MPISPSLCALLASCCLCPIHLILPQHPRHLSLYHRYHAQGEHLMATVIQPLIRCVSEPNQQYPLTSHTLSFPSPLPVVPASIYHSHGIHGIKEQQRPSIRWFKIKAILTESTFPSETESDAQWVASGWYRQGTASHSYHPPPGTHSTSLSNTTTHALNDCQPTTTTLLSCTRVARFHVSSFAWLY